MGKSKGITILLLLMCFFLMEIAHAEEFYKGQAESKVQFADGTFVFGMESGIHKTSNEPVICLYTAMQDNHGNCVWPITRFDLISGDKKWSWHEPVVSQNESIVFLSPNESDVLTTLSLEENVQLEIHYYTRHMIISLTNIDEIRTLAQQLLDVDALTKVSTESGSLTGEYVLNHPVKRNHAASETQLSSESLSQIDGKDIEK